ncbi:MAG: hypothetical protein ROR55_14900 [Devosia sp.]
MLSYFTAQNAPLLAPFGQAGWVIFALIISLIIAILLWIMATINRQNAFARYLEMMALRDGQIDPSAKYFRHRTIPVQDLNLPEKSLHEDKIFEGCVFGGPGALLIVSGKLIGCSFAEIGSVIVLPRTANITGIPALQDCTIKDCSFYRITLLVSQEVGYALKTIGADTVGSIDK